MRRSDAMRLLIPHVAQRDLGICHLSMVFCGCLLVARFMLRASCSTYLRLGCSTVPTLSVPIVLFAIHSSQGAALLGKLSTFHCCGLDLSQEMNVQTAGIGQSIMPQVG